MTPDDSLVWLANRIAEAAPSPALTREALDKLWHGHECSDGTRHPELVEKGAVLEAFSTPPLAPALTREALLEWVASVRAKFHLPDPKAGDKPYWSGYEAALADVERAGDKAEAPFLPEYDNHLFTANDSKALENVVIALARFDREADKSPCFCPSLDNIGADGKAINELSHQPRCRSARIHLGVARGLAGDKAACKRGSNDAQSIAGHWCLTHDAEWLLSAPTCSAGDKAEAPLDE